MAPANGSRGPAMGGEGHPIHDRDLPGPRVGRPPRGAQPHTPIPGPRPSGPSGPRAACRGRRPRAGPVSPGHQATNPPVPRRGARWDEPPPRSRPRSRSAPASPAPTPRKPRSARSLPVRDPRAATRRLRAACAAPRWPRPPASPCPVRRAGSRDFPSAPRPARGSGRRAGRRPARPMAAPRVDRPARGGERGLPGAPSRRRRGPTPLLRQRVGRPQAERQPF